MRKFTKSEIEDMRQELAEDEWEALKEGGLGPRCKCGHRHGPPRHYLAALWGGIIPGYNIPDNEIVEEFLARDFLEEE